MTSYESLVKGMNMAIIEKAQDIEAWQKACELSKAIYAITGDGAFARDYGLRDLIRGAAVSVMSNIAEGFDRSGILELPQFLFIAKGSAAEAQAQIYIGLDAAYLSEEQFQRL